MYLTHFFKPFQCRHLKSTAHATPFFKFNLPSKAQKAKDTITFIFLINIHPWPLYCYYCLVANSFSKVTAIRFPVYIVNKCLISIVMVTTNNHFLNSDHYFVYGFLYRLYTAQAHFTMYFVTKYLFFFTIRKTFHKKQLSWVPISCIAVLLRLELRFATTWAPSDPLLSLIIILLQNKFAFDLYLT